MAEAVDTCNPPVRARGRGRGKSRGGLGKYLRARGRGRGRGRPAEWGQRLVLEGEEEVEIDEGERQEFERKYARRQLGSNADRYVEPEPEIDSEGEEVVEPEVDLSSFLERQRLSPGPSGVSPQSDEDEDVDKSLAHIGSEGTSLAHSKKGRVQRIEWDAELEEMSREKAAAEATRDLKARFRAQTAKQRGRSIARGGVSSLGRGVKQSGGPYVEAPPLPIDAPKPEKNEKEDMQDFLDGLLG
ncbi:hypothetical protein L227DRAFT_575028 [Lentinus tigrinus ALCF2SS1-6]|uniref:Uncharacterized protein n=1 Tax=Lentinus tigrinus ALCF2SS1-6 TaxID=1328759 RepID=A0A5C2SAY5_9APHY|nr:hypothetical protein L227DRAFT_575028 [Lentinus tigrinus ALCF2SS1-6]